MWTADDFPGAENVPWQLLIRARFAHEVDAVIASMVVGQLGARLSDKHAVTLARSATVRASAEPATADQKVGVLSLVASWEDGEICPKNWPFRWPPRRRGFEEFSDPITLIGLARAQELIGLGSPDLQGQLGAVIKDIAGQ